MIPIVLGKLNNCDPKSMRLTCNSQILFAYAIKKLECLSLGDSPIFFSIRVWPNSFSYIMNRNKNLHVQILPATF